jgi:MoaA/NifB/PqqE/SkfB family radical SAM enzyme
MGHHEFQVRSGYMKAFSKGTIETTRDKHKRSDIPPDSVPMQSDQNYRLLLSRSIMRTLRQASRIVGNDPALLLAAGRFLSHQKKAVSRRQEYKDEGVQVPPVMILSLTHRCNLVCHGCYLQAQHREVAPEMTLVQLRSFISQAVDLGVSFLVLAGGEPMIRKEEILTLACEFPDLIMAIYTNGTLITPEIATGIGKLKNLVPIISIEGYREETDARRSDGVYASALQAFSYLSEKKVFFGCSVTVTRSNLSEVTGDEFIREMIKFGCRLLTYVEYVPVLQGTEDVALTDQEHIELVRLLHEFSEGYPAIFLGFPGDESLFGGCLSAGRGFLHINPSGGLEPCPAAPFSDMNITRLPLKEALKSEFLARIRTYHGLLTESGGGCALWKNQEWTRSVLGQN